MIKDSLHNKKLDFKTNSKIETCKIMKEGSSEKNQLKKSQQQLISTHVDLAEDEIEKTEGKKTKKTSTNIIIHRVEWSIDMNPK